MKVDMLAIRTALRQDHDGGLHETPPSIAFSAVSGGALTAIREGPVTCEFRAEQQEHSTLAEFGVLSSGPSKLEANEGRLLVFSSSKPGLQWRLFRIESRVFYFLCREETTDESLARLLRKLVIMAEKTGPRVELLRERLKKVVCSFNEHQMGSSRPSIHPRLPRVFDVLSETSTSVSRRELPSELERSACERQTTEALTCKDQTVEVESQGEEVRKELVEVRENRLLRIKLTFAASAAMSVLLFVLDSVRTAAR